MKHAKVVKAVLIGGKQYTNPTHAAKRWVETVAHDIHTSRPHISAHSRAISWRWYRSCWIVAGKKQRHWRRVLPIFEKLLK